ncbi:MAG: hypothetical protein V9F01_05005 [Chitinophagaceae bacterium]
MKGGQLRKSQKTGEFIVWPENISLKNGKDYGKLLNVTTLGENFDLSSRRLNLILSELGWIEKDVRGWKLTNLGKSLGGKQREHEIGGNLFVLWPENILKNKRLIEVCQPANEILVISPPKQILEQQKNPQNGNLQLHEKFPPSIKTKDGHLVRSKAELIIDNTLYDFNLAHAYERRLPIEENAYSDFFLRNNNVYIEYWGMEKDEKYLARQKVKCELYKKYGFNLIELTDDDIKNLDDHLPKKLLKFGIKVY